MSVVFKPFIIFDIEPIKKAELVVMGVTLHKKPDLDMYRVKAVLKSYIEKTEKGFQILEKLGQGEKLGELNKIYIEQSEAFTVYLPMTHKTINKNKYGLGSEIIVAYYPPSVYAKWCCDGIPDNKEDYDRYKEYMEGVKKNE